MIIAPIFWHNSFFYHLAQNISFNGCVSIIHFLTIKSDNFEYKTMIVRYVIQINK